MLEHPRHLQAGAAAVPSAPAAGYEVELKLVAPAGSLGRLGEAPVVAQHAAGKGVVRHLVSTYFDTPDGDLFRKGISLRVRRSGSRRLQTLKLAPSGHQAFARREWEEPIDGETPDLARLPVAEIGAPLDGLAPERLVPVFTTRVRRRLRRLDLPGASIEVAFDEGTIEAGDRREALCEVELELKAGDAAQLSEVALRLLEVEPLRIGTLSKSDRGYALAFALQRPATKAGPVPLTADHVTDDVLAVLLGACQRHLLANQAAAEEGRDPEGVHQARVALRRMRTALTVLRREVPSPALTAIADEAKWLASELGPARNWDVFATRTMNLPAGEVGPMVDFTGLAEAARPHREASHAAVRQAFGSERYTRFVLSLAACVERRSWRTDLASDTLAALSRPAPDLAGRVLSRLHRKVLRQGRHFARMSADERHQLRLTLKKLRYAVEFFLPLFPANGPQKRYLRELADLQDVLGHANDVATTTSLLAAVTAGPLPGMTERAVGALIGWQACEERALARSLRQRWRRLRDAQPFWA